ncbi:hypothetical protein SeLEV6574_g07343 [Synchytrium endobioticum]|uniref:BZIP domain-containing protein n=1 Tax=Synchytrium endobioticum TaxID=286115 RepID=A0A507CI74_9FUNG|nr:hypothetical protein SeLEV6574_g07343 [Synchytrium endobioticum]
MDPLAYLNLPAAFHIQQQQQAADDLTSWLNADFAVADSSGLRDPVTPPPLFPTSPLLPSISSPSNSPDDTRKPPTLSAVTPSFSDSLSNSQNSPKSTPEERTLGEQEKRKRTRLASARFRQRKKLKEQSLERAARDMSSKVSMASQQGSAKEQIFCPPAL